MQRHPGAGLVARLALFWDHGEGAAGAGESRGLGEATEFQGHLAGAWNLEDAVGQARIAHERLVGRIEEDDRLVLLGPGHPARKRCARHHGAGRVIGRAEIDKVHAGFGQGRIESVLRGGGQVDQARVAAFVVGRAGAARHHVGVDVHRIDRVGHGHHAVERKDLLHVGGVALGSVGDEDLIRLHLGALAAVVGRDGVKQKLIALLGTVAAKGLFARHLVGAGLERVHDGRGQGQHHVADAQPDNTCRRMSGRIRPHSLADFGE